jgi:hypothetical protein
LKDFLAALNAYTAIISEGMLMVAQALLDLLSQLIAPDLATKRERFLSQFLDVPPEPFFPIKGVCDQTGLLVEMGEYGPELSAHIRLLWG